MCPHICLLAELEPETAKLRQLLIIIVCFPGMTSSFQHVNKSPMAHFKTFFQQIRYFCDLSQYSNGFVYIKDRRGEVYFNK